MNLKEFSEDLSKTLIDNEIMNLKLECISKMANKIKESASEHGNTLKMQFTLNAIAISIKEIIDK